MNNTNNDLKNKNMIPCTFPLLSGLRKEFVLLAMDRKQRFVKGKRSKIREFPFIHKQTEVLI